MITPELISAIKTQYRLDWNGRHGVRHWARVFEIGCKLAEQTGANRNVVELFAIFHDSRRFNEHTDPGHGPRAAELVGKLRGTYLPTLHDEEFSLLCLACHYHTSASTHENITVQTCFDADRLDLGRVGKMPNPQLLCTDFARTKKMIVWAYRNSIQEHIPDNVLGNCVVCN